MHDNDPHYFLLCACILVSGADTEPELPPDVVEEIKKQLEEGQQRALQQTSIMPMSKVVDNTHISLCVLKNPFCMWEIQVLESLNCPLI